MALLDKSGVLPRLAAGERLSVDLGCGPNKRDGSSIGVDALDFDGVDIVGDVFEALASFPDGSISACRSSHFFEHVDDLSRLVDELARTMVRGSTLTVRVPHFANPYFYSDPTHRRFFGLYTFSYFAKDDLLRRKVPSYGRSPAFELVAVKLGFNSPFLVRALVKRMLGRVFNVTTRVQEFYEENLSYLLPCYDVEYHLRRL